MAFDMQKRIPKILQVGSSYLVLNMQDALDLRRERIVGAMTGTMPNATHQNEELALPMKLMFEQVLFLKSNGMAEIVRLKAESTLPRDDVYRKAYQQWLQLEISRQSVESHQRNIESRLACAYKIALGQKTKQAGLESTDSSEGETRPKKIKIPAGNEAASALVTSADVAAVEKEIRESPLRRLNETELQKEIWTDSPLLINDEHFESSASSLAPQNEFERLRYNVFVDLWRKGYFLTSGFKFGGDFLAYAGDPLLYHASHIVVCLPDRTSVESTDIAAWCRLGTQVKKIVLLCSWDESNGSKIAYKQVKGRMLTLVNLCLLAIRDYIEQGPIQQVHELPPRWHQIILDFVLMHGTILKETCLSTLSTRDFLRSFTSFSTARGRVNDNDFLDRVSDTLSMISGADENRFRRLVLNLYGYTSSVQGLSSKQETTIENFQKVVRLISKCPDVKALYLRFIISDSNTEMARSNGSIIRFLPLSSSTSSTTWRPLGNGGILNALVSYRSCLTILENLTDLSLITVEYNGRRQPPLLTSHQPLIAFTRLTSLRLTGGTAYFDAWFRFLNSVSGTLEFLHLENVEFHWGRERNACVLPFRMPKLVSLNAHGILSYVDSTFVRNLQKCDRLQSISLTLSGLESEENLVTLSKIDAVKDIRLNFRHGLFAERGADEMVEKLVTLFGDKITSFIFNGVRTPPLSMACQLLVDVCKNLVSFRLDTTASINESDQPFLAPLFNEKRRAGKLRDLELHGRLSPKVLSFLFENCLYLDSLTLWDCPQLTDVHLKQWASLGAQPYALKLVNCPKLTDEGLIGILTSCGLRLTQFRCTWTETNSKISERTLIVLAECCRNIEWVCFPASVCSDSMLRRIRAKSFKVPVKAVLVRA